MGGKGYPHDPPGGRAVAGSNPVSPIHQKPANEGFFLTSGRRRNLDGEPTGNELFEKPSAAGRHNDRVVRAARARHVARSARITAQTSPPAGGALAGAAVVAPSSLLGLESAQPRLHRGLAKTPVATESNVGNAPGPRLGPDPVGPHAESLGDLLGGQQSVHGVQFADALIVDIGMRCDCGRPVEAWAARITPAIRRAARS